VGDNERFGAYRLGGSFGDSSFTALPDEWRSLRGFQPASVFGDTFYLGSLEYRLPLLYVDRGVGTVPAFFREISAAAFIDAGNAFNTADEALDPFSTTLIGAGAELRGSAIFLWQVPLTARVGYAFPLRGPGFSTGPLQGFYAWLGSSF
jgi:outer membrane protein assembly factor BamA